MRTINYNISINEELAKVVDREMKAKKYANRSEFFRDLIRKMIFCKEDNRENYKRELDKKLTEAKDAIKKGEAKGYIKSEDLIRDLKR